MLYAIESPTDRAHCLRSVEATCGCQGISIRGIPEILGLVRQEDQGGVKTPTGNRPTRQQCSETSSSTVNPQSGDAPPRQRGSMRGNGQKGLSLDQWITQLRRGHPLREPYVRSAKRRHGTKLIGSALPVPPSLGEGPGGTLSSSRPQPQGPGLFHRQVLRSFYLAFVITTPSCIGLKHETIRISDKLSHWCRVRKRWAESFNIK